MNELTQEIHYFEAEANQQTTALKDKLTTENHRRELEALVRETIDFIVILAIGDVITQDQTTERNEHLPGHASYSIPYMNHIIGRTTLS